jgi:arsenate reductase-like glutaredoxin family protein
MHEKYHIVGDGSNRMPVYKPFATSYNAHVIQIYGRKKCKGTKKAERFFSERRVPFQSIDLDKKAPGGRELELFADVAGVDALLDTEGKSYRQRGFAYLDFDPLAEITEDPSLLRTPIVREGRALAIGEDEEFWRSLAERAKS